MKLQLLALLWSACLSPVPEASAATLNSVSLNAGGRYLYFQQVGVQAEVQPLSFDWLRAEGGASISYKDAVTVYALSVKGGPTFGWFSPFLMVGTTFTVFEAISFTDHVGLGLQIKPVEKWYASVEGAMTLFGALNDISIGFGIGYRL